MTDATETVRRAVYAVLVDTGRGPSVRELAQLTGVPGADVEHALTDLAARHAVVLTAAGDAVRMAHPFSAAPMGFVVAPLDRSDDRMWWGGCAWDSFGMSAAMGLDVVVTTACPWCGHDHRLSAGPHVAPTGDAVVRFPLPASAWWDDVVATCTEIRVFCTQGHAEQWATSHSRAPGEVVPVQTVWALAQPWYGDRLAPGFRPHSRAHNQQLLTDHGLVGEFWRLP